MNKRLTLIMLALLLAFVPAAVAQTTYEQLTSIADIDEDALYVLGVEDIGFHYSGTSSWGNVTLPSEETTRRDGCSFCVLYRICNPILLSIRIFNPPTLTK